MFRDTWLAVPSSIVSPLISHAGHIYIYESLNTAGLTLVYTTVEIARLAASTSILIVRNDSITIATQKLLRSTDGKKVSQRKTEEMRLVRMTFFVDYNIMFFVMQSPNVS